MPPLIRLEQVTKCYLTGGSSEVYPLRDVNLEIAEGERIILLGKSGSGKSTFLNMVGGVDLPSSGRIFVDGRDISALSPEELAHYRRRDVGFVFQSFNLFSTLTVGENVMLPLELLGKADRAKAQAMLDAVGLGQAWDKFPEQLSGGEQQRVAIARALVKDPKLILADEPTGNLDLETSNGILELIDRICVDFRATLIMATHSYEALWIGQRRFRLRGGKLIEETRKPLSVERTA
ncbi:MAG: ABC transporter ATP-binding protein [Thermodesulfobacteriota bacterium]